MNIMINRDLLEHTYEQIEENVNFLIAAADAYISNHELKDMFKFRLAQISYQFKQVYDPELIQLKQNARIYYQCWMLLKEKHTQSAQIAYDEYLNVKNKIREIQCPF